MSEQQLSEATVPQPEQSIPQPDSPDPGRHSMAEIQDAINLVTGQHDAKTETQPEKGWPESEGEQAVAEARENDAGQSTLEQPKENETPASMAEAALQSEEKPAEEEPEVESTKDDPPSKVWTRAMKAERAARQMQKQLKTQQKEFQAQYEQFQQQSQQLQADMESMHADPIGFLRSKGVDYQKAFSAWTKSLADGTEPGKPPESEALAEIRRLRAELDERDRLRTENHQKQQYEQEAAKWMNDADTVLKDEKYAVLKEMGAEQEMSKLAVMWLQQTGELLTPLQSADKLLPIAIQRLQRLTALPAAKQAMGGAPPNGQQAQQQQAQSTSQGPRTITNDMSPRTAPVVRDEDDPLESYREIRAAAKLVPLNAWNSGE